MYRTNKMQKTSIKLNTSYKGETIEEKVSRVTTNKEPIKDGAPLIYTDRKEGVSAAYDIRTDRFEIAVEAMDKVTAATRAKRDGVPTIGEKAKEGMKKEDKTEDKKEDKKESDGGTKPAAGTEAK